MHLQYKQKHLNESLNVPLVVKITDLGLNMLLKVVENRPKLSPVQLSAVVVVVLVEEGPQ